MCVCVRALERTSVLVCAATTSVFSTPCVIQAHYKYDVDYRLIGLGFPANKLALTWAQVQVQGSGTIHTLSCVWDVCVCVCVCVRVRVRVRVRAVSGEDLEL